MNTHTPTRAQKQNLLVLVLLFLIILGPVVFAWILVKKADAQQLRLSNHGDLITPPRSIGNTPLFDLNKQQKISAKSLLGKWYLVYVSPAQCIESCSNILYNMRQIRTALGKNADRLERLFIAHPACTVSLCEKFISENYPEVLKIRMAQPDFEIVFGPISNKTTREMIGELYIIDPHGNIMMHYTADTESRDILSDLKRLLRVSKSA